MPDDFAPITIMRTFVEGGHYTVRAQTVHEALDTLAALDEALQRLLPPTPKMIDTPAGARAAVGAPEPAPADPPCCPAHGEVFIKPSKFGGLYCATTNDDGSWCSWKAGKARKAS
jgi:hypothetical protein